MRTIKTEHMVLSKDIFFPVGGPVSSSAESLQKYLSYDQINILQFIIANKWKMSISQMLSKMCLLWWMQNKYRDLALRKVGQRKNSKPLTSGNRVSARQGCTKICRIFLLSKLKECSILSKQTQNSASLNYFLDFGVLYYLASLPKWSCFVWDSPLLIS